MIRAVGLYLAAAAMLGVAVSACGGGLDDRGIVKALQADFRPIERLHLTRLWVGEGCDYIVYGRGAFVTDPASEGCEIDVGNPTPRVALDAQAKADLTALSSAFRSNGPALTQARVKYNADDTVAPDSQFSFSQGCWFLCGGDPWYVYRPTSETKARFVDSTCAEQVDPDWWKAWSC